MEIFKVGDRVYAEEDFIYGRIVEINGDVAHVEFRTSGGGGCLSYKLSELVHEKWCITTDNLCHDGIVYLAWQKPAGMKMDISGQAEKLYRKQLEIIHQNIHFCLIVERKLLNI